jgi:tetratricopeptide (TPR) repeat protein
VAREAETPEAKLEIYTEYQDKFPRAQAPKRLPLNFLSGAELESRLSIYVRAALRKGVPPLFVDLRPLYNKPECAELIHRMMTGFLDNQLKLGSFDCEGAIMQEPPTSLLWTYYFLAQHYDHKKDYAKALELINAAIEHTPTLIELFTLKGKIYKHAGDPEEAVRCLDEAQSMDTADRYINCKCAKYMLRANKVAEAEAMCGKFTREGVPAMDNLNEMQCMWFQSECALAFQRLGMFGESLKKCSEIDRHFTEIIEDQFDFHTYCMRKMTLKAYVDLLRLENQLRSHKFYEKTATVAIRTYIRLYDKPLQDTDENSDKNAADMDPSELKKQKNKAKKAKRKAEQEKAAAEQDKKRKELHNKNKKKNDEELDSPAKDELVPEKLARPEDPLDEAAKFLQPLLTLSTKNINTHLLAFEIYYRKGKAMLMLRAIKQAMEMDSTNTQLHSCLARFIHFVSTSKDIPDAVRKVVSASQPSVLSGKSALELNSSFLAAHPNKLPAQFTAAKVMAVINPSQTGEAVQLATKLGQELVDKDLDTCAQVLEALQMGDLGAEGKAKADQYKESCRHIFPLAKCFMNNQNCVSVTASNHVTISGEAEDS